jgi:hypothetical protein
MPQYSALYEERAARNWTKAEKPPACKGCAGSAVVVQRLAASCAARAAYWRARYTQASEELRAGRERRRARVVAIARLEVDDKAVAALRAVPPCDLCVACHHEVEKVRGWVAGAAGGRESMVTCGFCRACSQPIFGHLPHHGFSTLRCAICLCHWDVSCLFQLCYTVTGLKCVAVLVCCVLQAEYFEQCQRTDCARLVAHYRASGFLPQLEGEDEGQQQHPAVPTQHTHPADASALQAAAAAPKVGTPSGSADVCSMLCGMSS